MLMPLALATLPVAAGVVARNGAVAPDAGALASAIQHPTQRASGLLGLLADG